MLTSNNTQPSSNQRSTPMKRSPQAQKSVPSNQCFQNQTAQQTSPLTSTQARSTSDDIALNCPRCDSTNTKFCYYNNYNKTQPRHYCKACKRHWTKGGTLRNVPIGGRRKNKCIKRPNTTSKATATTTIDDQILGLISDHKYMFPNDESLFLKPHDSEFDHVSWDFSLGFSSIDTNPIPVIEASCTPLLSVSKDDSTLTTTGPDSSTVLEPWMQVPTTSSFLDCWTWNDIDSMIQADMIKPFDDPHMKN